MKSVAQITVRRTCDGPPAEFAVTIEDARGQSRHAVTVGKDTAAAWKAAGHAPEPCLEAAFRFLLEREPKEAILPRFDVSVISRYFPEFERELPGYLRQP